MVNSFRLGTAAMFVLIGLAGCTNAPQTQPVEAWGPSPGHVENNYRGGTALRSKCDGLPAGDQRRNCYQFEYQDDDARFK